MAGQIVLKFGDMVDMDVKLCKGLKLKCRTRRLAHGRAPNHQFFFQKCFSLTTEVIVLNFLI